MYRPLTAVVLCLLVVGCESDPVPPTTSPGTNAGESITGRERIGWDQAAGAASELNSLRYAIYVDGVRSVLTDVTCGTSAGAQGFPCSARLPNMTPGTHTLELATFTDAGGVVESSRSAPLRVTVTGSTASLTPPLQAGDRVTTSDGVVLTAELLADDLHEPNDVAISADGRVFVAEDGGGIRVVSPDGRSDGRFAAPADAHRLLSLTLPPDFATTGHVFVTQVLFASSGEEMFRVARYRHTADGLVDRMVVLPELAASEQPSAALRFGPDAKLYAAFDDGGDPNAAVRLADWNGKVLRLNPDGRTPDDQPAASPVFWSGLRSPRAMDWAARTDLLWLIEEGVDGVERLRAISASAARPRRSGERGFYVLPRPLGATSMGFYPGDTLPAFAGNLFVAAKEGGYLLRVRFDETERTRAMSSERLLEGRVGRVRVVAFDPDGGLYVGTDDSLWRFTAASSRR